ncbi:MAG TPA: cellulase family glycosylhydrolase [Opitutaceae bacterium]
MNTTTLHPPAFDFRRLASVLRPLFLSLLLLTALAAPAGATVPWLHVDGNQIKDTHGNPVTLRGVSVLAPAHNNECTTCNRKPVSEMITWQADAARGWHSRIVRLQITPKVSDPVVNIAATIEPYVQQAIAKGLYIIVDLHFVSDYDAGTGTGVKQQFVLDFWNTVAPLYANTPNVLFEVFNEPINPDNWTSWKAYIQPVVDAIRAVAPNNLILIGGPQWSTRVNSAAANPIAGSNLVYVYHIYPNQGAASETNLNAKFGTAAQTIPVMVTEFGWNQDPNYSNTVTFGTTSAWGTPFRTYLDARPHISWTGYIFDNFWKPQYFDWDWNLMAGENQGEFMRQWFLETKDDHQPQPDALTAAGVTAGQINLAWPATAGALSYNVKRATTSGGPYTTVATGVTATNYSDTGLSALTTYHYVISAVTAGGEGPDSAPASATTEGGGIAPDVPLSITATASDAQVLLNWSVPTGATSYDVKRSTTSGGPYTTIATGITTPSYTDTTVSNGTVYYYVVSAVNGLEEGAPSAEVSDMPSAVTVIVDNADSSGVEINGTWTASSSTAGYYGANYLHEGNTGATGGKSVRFSPNLPPAGSYLVSMRWAAGSNRATNAPIDVTHATGTTGLSVKQWYSNGLWVPLGVFDFAAGTAGNVLVRNDGADGYVIADAVKFALVEDIGPTPPNAPGNLAATVVSSSQIDLVWTDNSSNEDGFELQRATDAAFTLNVVTTPLAAGTTSTSATGLSGGTTYHFRVRAGNSVGTSAWSNPASAATPGAGGGVTTTVAVNQQFNGSAWNTLGSFLFDAGAAGFVKIRTDATSGYVIADAVKFSKAGQSDIIIDNAAGAGVTILGAWSASTGTPGYWETNYLHDLNADKGTKSVTFTPNLPVAGEWTVSLWWTAATNRAANVPVDISHAPAGGCIATATHVVGIDAVVTGNGGNKRGRATITVVDDCGNPVANATVTGAFSGTYNETGRTGVTNASGVATITTNGKSGGTPSVTFCVTAIAHASLVYDAAANVETCDSNAP